MPPSVVKRVSKAALPALALGFLSLAAPAQAQFYFRYHAEPFAWRYDDALSPGEIARSLEARGYRPTGRPWRNGEVYIVEARDDDGSRVRLIVDAYEGLILRRFREARPAPGPQILPRREASRTPPAVGPGVIEGIGPPVKPRAAPAPEPRRKAAAPRRETPRAASPPAASPSAVAPATREPVAPRLAPPPSQAVTPPPAPVDPPKAQTPPPAPPFVTGAPATVVRPPVRPQATEPAAAPAPARPAPASEAPAAPPVAPLDDARRPTQATPVVPVTPLN